MRYRNRTSLILCAFLTAQLGLGLRPAGAEPSKPGATPASTSSSKSAKKQSKVVPMLKGKPAPFSGLLVPEDRFKMYLHQKVDLDNLKYKLGRRDKMHADITSVLNKKLAEAQADLNKRAKPTPWYKSSTLWFAVGLVLGVGGTTAAVIAAKK